MNYQKEKQKNLIYSIQSPLNPISCFPMNTRGARTRALKLNRSSVMSCYELSSTRQLLSLFELSFPDLENGTHNTYLSMLSEKTNEMIYVKHLALSLVELKRKGWVFWNVILQMWFYNSVDCSWLIEDLFKTPRGTSPDVTWFISGNNLQLIKKFFEILGNVF